MAKVKISHNWIREIYYDPCDPDPWVMVELAFPALIQALWEYFQWDWEDVIEGHTGKPWQKWARNHLRGKGWHPPKFVAGGIRWLFIAEAGIQRIGWMFMIAEIVADAFIRWASMIMALPECNVDVVRHWGKSQVPISGMPGDHNWRVGPSWLTEQGDIIPYLGSVWSVGPGVSIYHVCFVKARNFITGTEVGVASRVRVVEDDLVLDQGPESDPGTNGKDSSGTAIKWKNGSSTTKTLIFEVKLSDAYDPLVWDIGWGFCSVNMFEARPGTDKLWLPYTAIPQPQRRHAPRKA